MHTIIPGPLVLRSFYILLLAFHAFNHSTYAQVTCNLTGTWSSTAGWSPAAPSAGQDVTVAAGCTLYVDVLTPVIGNLTINGVLIVNSNASSILTVSGNVVVNSGARLENNGSIDFQTAGNNFNLNGTAVYIHNPFTNLPSEENIFSNGNESFSTTSTLHIKKWSDGSVPLGSAGRVATSLFGNVILEAVVPGGIWDQDGCFALPVFNRIRGAFTVSAGTVVMDDGTGATVNLALNTVLVNNTGNLVFQRGFNRNLNLATGSVTIDCVAPALPTVIMDTSYGLLVWNLTGTLNINSDFQAINGNNFTAGADIRITVNGTANFTGGTIRLINNADAPLRLNVSGTTTFNNTSGSGEICFIEGSNGNLTFNTADLVITGGHSNFLLGKPGATVPSKGIGNVNITNDLTVNGASTTYIAYSDSNVNKVRISVGRDLLMNGSNSFLAGAHTLGSFTLYVARNIQMAQGKLIGQNNVANVAIDSIIAGSDFVFNSSNPTDYFKANRSSGNTIIRAINFSVMNSGSGYDQGVIGADSSAANVTFLITGNFIQSGGQFSGIQNGSGNLTFTVNGMVDMNGGIFRGHNNTAYTIPGNITFTTPSIDFDGGLFSGYYACSYATISATFNISGNCDISFSSVSDEFSFIGLGNVGPTINTISLSLTIGGSLNISGADGLFVSSQAGAAEMVTIGSVNISAGNNSFNSVQSSVLGNGHIVIMTVTGNFDVTGGNTFLSARSQNVTININGNLTISGGSLSLKGADCIIGTFNIVGGYQQTGGNFYLHNAPTDELNASALITMTVNSNDDNNGNFEQTGGSFYFDNAFNTPSSNLILNIKSPNYIIGGNGAITMSQAGTGSVFGILNFTRNGTISFNRSGSHLIQQTLQNVITGCTLDVVTGDVMLASHSSAPALPFFMMVHNGAVLDLHGSMVFSNALYNASGITVLGRVRTTHPEGMYNGTVNAAFSTNLTDNLDFYLNLTSTIEYYGSDNQVVSGTGIGKAMLVQHKYGNLEINFSGTPDVEFVYPTNMPHDSATIVRMNLVLTQGELNLDDDHDPSNSGGRWIVVENSAANAIQKINGYIRSEVEDGTGLVKWNVGTTPGDHVFPFGYNSGEYIPFTYSHAADNSGYIYAGTYHTAPNNQPYPPSVTHVRNNSGTDNSANTVDRFWMLYSTSTVLTGNLKFRCTPAEAGSISSLLAQRWVLPNSWTNPVPGTQVSVANGTDASSISILPYWWTLSGSSSLLPVELLSFTGECKGQSARLEWITASETANDYFVIQKMSPGGDWTDIATIDGSGTTSSVSRYSYDDVRFSGSSYYCLKQVDIDGQYEIFTPVYIRSCDDSKEDVLVASLTGGLFIINVTAPDGNYMMNVLDYAGRLLSSSAFSVEDGLAILDADLKRFSHGVYLIQISGTDFNTTRRIVLNN